MVRKWHNFGNNIMPFTFVADAERIILDHSRRYGIEQLPLDAAVGRILAGDIAADRDLPPYDRVTMDGIAIGYAAWEQGRRDFPIQATMAAGDNPVALTSDEGCIELMTGCALPEGADAVVRYEDVTIQDGVAIITSTNIRKGANIHRKGTDKTQGATVLAAGARVDASVISMAASVGMATLPVCVLPRVVIISTGDELVDVADVPTPYQVRRSNGYAIRAALQEYRVVADMLHITDEPMIMKEKVADCLAKYDAVILSGGVSMGKYDHVPAALEALGVTCHFHKVQQRPGKPFWFGSRGADGPVVFAFPGNPVSAFLCVYRYFIPWLQACLHARPHDKKYAVLAADISFLPELQYFLQVVVRIDPNGILEATPVEGNGSGDFSNLLQANAFMELPAEIANFKKGDVYPIWPFKPII